MDKTEDNYGNFCDLGFWDVNLTDGELNLCNRAKDIIGLSTGIPLRAKDALNRMGIQQKKELLFKIKASIASREKFYHDVQMNKEMRPFGIVGNIQYNANAQPERVTGVITTIPEKDSGMINKTDLLAIISHELKSPLTTIKLYIQLADKIARAAGGIKIDKYLALAVREVDNMNLLMENFLDLTATQTGGIRLAEQPFDITSLIDEVVVHWCINAPDHHIVYRAESPAFVYADLVKIRQVFHNLISNAVKYSARGTNIDITCIAQGQQVEICVKDQGAGISRQDQEKLFSRFSRVGKQSATRVEGHGMGLFLVREIINRHLGTVRLRSEEGQGSEFYITLPEISGCIMSDVPKARIACMEREK